MKLNIFQKGFNYMQDGPGNRLVYHLTGCNMHCPWCSNPEGMNIKSSSGKDYEIEKLVSEAESCIPMFFDGGGVTLTGGEICMQIDGALTLLRELRIRHISTAIESNATSPRFCELLPYVSYIMMDFKHYDSEILKHITGIGNSQIQQNIRSATEQGYYLHIRIPLIGHFNTSSADIDGFIAFFSQLNPDCFDVELLPYHEYGKDKWSKIGMPYTVTDGKVPAETIVKFKNAFTNNGIKLIRT